MGLTRLAPNHVDAAPREVSPERKGRSFSPSAAFSHRFSLSPSRSRKRKPHKNHSLVSSSLSPKGQELSRGRSLTLRAPEHLKRRSHSSFGRLTQNRWPSSLGSCAWDVSEHILEALASTAQFSTVPYLGTLCTIALAIFNAVRTTKDNQDVLNQLAFAACDMVYTVHKTYQDLYPLHPSPLSHQNLKTQFSSDLLLKEHINELMRNLMDINAWISEKTSKNILQRLISSRADVSSIENFKYQLNETKNKFQAQSLIVIRSYLTRIAAQQNIIQEDAASHHNFFREKLMTIHDDINSSRIRRSVSVDSGLRIPIIPVVHEIPFLPRVNSTSSHASQSTLVDDSRDTDPERMLNGDDSESILVFGRKRKLIDSTSITRPGLEGGQGTPGLVSDTSCELVADPESLDSFALEKTQEAAGGMEAGIVNGSLTTNEKLLIKSLKSMSSRINDMEMKIRNIERYMLLQVSSEGRGRLDRPCSYSLPPVLIDPDSRKQAILTTCVIGVLLCIVVGVRAGISMLTKVM
ncbi:hypothetical protein F5051DRAFT_438970 [Lentinula edodes]|nr:hypothetical protein F5051DRAFT_438970 [Lentinula edodes]